MFSQHHYVAIAKVLKETRPKKAVGQWKLVVDELDKMFRENNPRFSSDRFVNACNYYGDNQ